MYLKKKISFFVSAHNIFQLYTFIRIIFLTLSTFQFFLTFNWVKELNQYFIFYQSILSTECVLPLLLKTQLSTLVKEKKMIFSLCTIYLIKSTEIPECTAPTLEAAWTYPQRGPWFLWTCSQAFLTIPNIHSQKKKQKNWLTNLYLKLFKSSDLEMKTCPTEKVTCLGM